MHKISYIPNERATKLIDVPLAEDAPKAITRGMFGAEKARVFEEEADIGKLFVVEARKESREGLGMAGKVLMAVALIVIQLAHLAELEFRPSLLLLVTRRIAFLRRSISFRIRVFHSRRFSRLHYRTENYSYSPSLCNLYLSPFFFLFFFYKEDKNFTEDALLRI